MTHLLVNGRHLLEALFQGGHLLLLALGVGVPEEALVLVAGLVKVDFELHHLLATILEILHQVLLHPVEFFELLALKKR